MVFMTFCQNLQLSYLCQQVENAVVYLHVFLGHARVLINVCRAVCPNIYLRELTVLSNGVPIHSGCVWDLKDVDALQFPSQFPGLFGQLLGEGIVFWQRRMKR